MKKLFFLLFVGTAFLALLLFPYKAAKAQPLTSQASSTTRLIVKFKRFTPRFFKDRALSAHGSQIREELRLADTVVVEVPESRIGEITSGLKKSLVVGYVERDFVATAFEIPNDPRFSDQWGLTKIEAPGGWDKTHGSGQIDIAIADTGIDGSHPDLGGKIIASVNCTAGPSCPSVAPTDIDGHGTHVSGIASAVTNNSMGIAGTSWEGRLMNVKVLDDDGSGWYSWVINGIIYAADNGAEVINLSLGGTSSSSALSDAVDYAWGKGVVVVAAAGNSGRSRGNYPAYYSNAIAVAATTQNDTKASFSNYGSWVDVAAPGVSIISTYKGGYEYLSGTSMSVPYVSGLAALLFGQNSGWSNSQVRNRIESTADKISRTGTYWIHGRINVCRAVGCEEIVTTPVPTSSATPTSVPTPTATPTTTGTPTTAPTPTLTSTPTSTPTLLPTSTPTATPSSTPTPSPLPWWCVYIPRHYRCK